MAPNWLTETTQHILYCHNNFEWFCDKMNFCSFINKVVMTVNAMLTVTALNEEVVLTMLCQNPPNFNL